LTSSPATRPDPGTMHYSTGFESSSVLCEFGIVTIAHLVR
jgi:hypothetical protein